jgi:archaellum component FlaF (FlaF/FlaG flagellin family)
MMTQSKVLGVAVLAILLASIIPIAIPVTGEQQDSQAYAVLLVRARVLYTMLNRSLGLNISAELRSEIQKLLAVNISALPVDELREWVNNASKLLAKVNEEVRVGGRAYAVGIALQRYLNGLTKALEERLRKLNISIPVNLTRARDISELNKLLRNVSGVVEAEKVHRFVNASLVVALRNAVKSVKSAEEAQKHLMLAEKAINATIERLKKLNASEEAIERLQVALEKVREAREILANATQVAKQKAKSIEDALREALENRTAQLLMDIESRVEELKELRENITDVRARQVLDQIIDRLEELRERLENASVENITRWMPDLGEVRGWLKNIERTINASVTPFIPVWIPGRGIDKAFNETIAKAKELLQEVKQMLAEVNKTREMVCIAIYPPPPICKAIIEGRAVIDSATKLVAKAEAEISLAEKLYAENRKLEALTLANRAYAELSVAKAWLEPIYNTIKRTTTTTTTATSPSTPTPTQAQAVRIKEAKLEKVSCSIATCTYRLTLTIENVGSTTITVNSIRLNIAGSFEKTVNVVIEPGKEVTITVNVEASRFTSIETPVHVTIVTSQGVVTAQVQV